MHSPPLFQYLLALVEPAVPELPRMLVLAVMAELADLPLLDHTSQLLEEVVALARLLALVRLVAGLQADTELAEQLTVRRLALGASLAAFLVAPRAMARAPQLWALVAQAVVAAMQIHHTLDWVDLLLMVLPAEVLEVVRYTTALGILGQTQ